MAVGPAWLAACSVIGGVAAAAPEGGRPVRLRVRSSVCTDAPALWAAIARRTPRLRPAGPGDVADVVDVDVRREGRRVVGRMQILPEGEAGPAAPAPRVVTGDSCEDVVAAVSLMTALAFDPDSAGPPPAPGSPAVRGAPWTVAAGAGATTSTLGDPAWGAGVFVDVERAPSERRAVGWAASWRLAAAVAAFGAAAGPVQGGGTWRVLEVDGCPWRATWADGWTLRPCASVEGGAIEVSVHGPDVQNARSITRPWVAPGARARVTWSPGAALVVGVDVASVFPLIRDEFKVDPSVRVFRAGAVAGELGVSVGVRFL